MQQRQFGNAVLLRRNERKKMAVPGNPATYQLLSPEGLESLAMYSVNLAPNQSTGTKALQHGGDENLLILAGTVEVEIEGLKYTLGPGDSVFTPRGQRHRVTNVGAETAEAVFVISPPQY